MLKHHKSRWMRWMCSAVLAYSVTGGPKAQAQQPNEFAWQQTTPPATARPEIAPQPAQAAPQTLPVAPQPNILGPGAMAAQTAAMSGAAGQGTGRNIAPVMLGDDPVGGGQLTGAILATRSSSSSSSSQHENLYPSVRGFKIAVNESPKPLDRVFLDFNYYNRVNEVILDRTFSILKNIQVYRETFGFEKTFLDGNASIGMRLPLYTVGADNRFPQFASPTFPGFPDHDTDLGDLAILFKYAFLNDEHGNVWSAGLAININTGNDSLGGFGPISTFHSTTLQPWTGYIWDMQDWYLLAFHAIDVPTDLRDVTILYTDIGLGYRAYRSAECSGLTGITPTVEVHVGTPLSHRGALDFTDSAGTADVVDLTLGATIDIGQRASLNIGYVQPLTGPRPFDFEILAQLNWRLGAR